MVGGRSSSGRAYERAGASVGLPKRSRGMMVACRGDRRAVVIDRDRVRRAWEQKGPSRQGWERGTQDQAGPRDRQGTGDTGTERGRREDEQRRMGSRGHEGRCYTQTRQLGDRGTGREAMGQSETEVRQKTWIHTNGGQWVHMGYPGKGPQALWRVHAQVPYSTQKWGGALRLNDFIAFWKNPEKWVCSFSFLVSRFPVIKYWIKFPGVIFHP